MSASLIAHGKKLVNRIIPDSRKDDFLLSVQELKTYTISDADSSVFHRIADGALSPLEGPMNKVEFDKVLEEEVIIRNGRRYAWTIPIVFPATKEEAQEFKLGQIVAVKTKLGKIEGTLKIEEIYTFDKKKYNSLVYGTNRTDHPGPRIVNEDKRDFLLAGKIEALPQEQDIKFAKYMLSPKETREFFSKKGWQRVVAFQTRNALHRAHEYTMVYALERLTSQGYFTGCVLNPLVGATKKDDVPQDVRMHTYEALIENKLIGVGDKNQDFWKTKEYDLADQIILIGLDMKMFYAGPKEAIMHAIYRQNYGFTDIIIGRKHADAHFDNGDAAWGDFDAQDKFDNLAGNLEIKPVKIGFAAFFKELGRVGLMSEYKDKNYTVISISGKDLRKKLVSGEPIDKRIMRKHVSDILEEYYAK